MTRRGRRLRRDIAVPAVANWALRRARHPAALRRGTRVAADEGAPDLDATLFAPVARAATKNKAPEKQVPTVSQTPAAA